jgi:hypothetical protein
MRRPAEQTEPATEQTYAVDWFSDHVPSWRKHLSHLAGQPKLRALVVGPYEGRCLAWLFENIMTSSDCSATVVDSFEYEPCVGYLGKGVWNPHVESTFRKNMASIGRSSSVRVIKQSSSAGLRKLSSGAETYDIVYIDARSSLQALEALVLVLPLMKKQGILVVTNYVHSKEHDTRCPRRGIDAFMDIFSSEVKVLSNRFHTFMQKRSTSLRPGGPCYSEAYPEPRSRPTCSGKRQARSPGTGARTGARTMTMTMTMTTMTKAAGRVGRRH